MSLKEFCAIIVLIWFNEPTTFFEFTELTLIESSIDSSSTSIQTMDQWPFENIGYHHQDTEKTMMDAMT